ncbi:molybdate ABC transporter substrate-binding protein [Crassaminicella profunda]|uniref:molybdate ABC transporter substrate-binding protein n=1 Tax=Crassaminicella profunda TaxID=1286698 RepID=UPI001CA78087|nr:molybdate ABC transporter substrate-binding protein [Crassaminicella profunda]QZY54038.1 molybdate ABC transporter substrate-binding protein [Crassaminicella profunda]
MKKIKGWALGICILMFLAIVLTGCSVKASEEENKQQEITVFAAASLTESMEEIVNQFEKENPHVKVNLHLAGSSQLRVQIEQGVKADLFLSANKKHYDALKNKDFVLEGKHFLSNSMVVMFPKNNPAKIKTLKDIEKTCKLIVAQEEVPAGQYARQIIHSLAGELGKKYEEKVLANVVSNENNVKQVVNKVVLGEGDAGIVYKSDITKNIKDKVNIVEIPVEHNVEAAYWMAVVKDSKENKDVQEFYEFLLKEGQGIFEKYGFEKIH